MKLFIKMLAFICDVCPLCIAARHFPDSKFALGMKRLEKFCPFCSAHRKLEQKERSPGK